MKEAWRYLIIIILVLSSGAYITFHSDITVPLTRPLSEFPVQHAGWTMISQSEFSDNVLNVLKATDYISRVYKSADGTKVTLYIGYHSGGKDSGGIHSPRHCLPGSGWFELSSKREQLAVGKEKINLAKALYQKGENRELFHYWFQVRDRSLNDEYSLKIAETTGSLLYRRRDTSFVRVSVPYAEDEARASAVGEQFIRDFYQVIRAFLPE